MPEAVVAITGASGAQYGVRLLDGLLDAGWEVSLIVTNAGAINLDLECGITPEELANRDRVSLRIIVISQLNRRQDRLDTRPAWFVPPAALQSAR